MTQKMLANVGGLDLEKYSKLSSAIFFELTDQKRWGQADDFDRKLILIGSDKRPINIKNGHKLVDAQGTERDVGGLTVQASMFFAGLNWLAFRTIFYTIAANSLGADLFLHPIRHAFQVNFLSKLHQSDSALFKPLIDAMNGTANVSINKILSTTQPIVTKQTIPLFVAWFAQKVGDPHKYIETAYELRETSYFREAQQKLFDLESIENTDRGKFVIESNKMIREVEQSLAAICSRYKVTTNQGLSSSSLIKFWNLSTLITKLPSIPEFNFQIPALESIKTSLPQRGFRAVYRNIVSDLTQVSHLGELYDIASSRIFLHKDAGTYLEKTEDVKYQKHISHWKIPM